MTDEELSVRISRARTKARLKSIGAGPSTIYIVSETGRIFKQKGSKGALKEKPLYLYYCGEETHISDTMTMSKEEFEEKKGEVDSWPTPEED